MYYLPIDELIKKCGRQYITDMLLYLSIEINTSSAKDREGLFNYSYIGSSLTNIPTMEDYIKQSSSSKQEHIKEHLEDIQTIINIFPECKNKCIIQNYDYVVFSYLGDFIVKYENQVGLSSSGKSLYFDIQSVRIALIDEIIRKQWIGYYSMFNYGFKFIGGLFLFRFAYNYFYGVKKMITM